MIDARVGDVWRSGPHVAYVVVAGALEWDDMFKEYVQAATLLYLEGLHAGSPPTRTFMSDGLWTLIARTSP